MYALRPNFCKLPNSANSRVSPYSHYLIFAGHLPFLGHVQPEHGVHAARPASSVRQATPATSADARRLATAVPRQPASRRPAQVAIFAV